MEKEYTRTFSIKKLYELITRDADSVEDCPFETDEINKPFYEFCEKRLPRGFEEHEKAYSELSTIIQKVEGNAFVVGFKMAVNLMK